MPEGPSIVILREAVQALHLEGKRVTSVTGNTKIDKERMLHREVKAFRSWGKHFLVCFGDFTLRVHLLLFGSYRINEEKDTPVRLQLAFGDATLNFYACSLKYIEGDLDAVYDWSADIMSPDWNAVRAVKKLQAKPQMLACDALLDQDIVAGSGNIIKNEVLYRLKIHPLSVMEAMPVKLLKALVAETHTYGFEFLEWKKAFTLKEHWLAHTRNWCYRCALPLSRQHLGKTHRRTFYCDNCQKLYV